jgi:hypothetical protein
VSVVSGIEIPFCRENRYAVRGQNISILRVGSSCHRLHLLGLLSEVNAFLD